MGGLGGKGWKVEIFGSAVRAITREGGPRKVGTAEKHGGRAEKKQNSRDWGLLRMLLRGLLTFFYPSFRP